MKYVVTNWDNEFCSELLRAVGVDPNVVRRVVLDFEVGSPAKMHLETFADDAVLRVVPPEPVVQVVS